MVPSRAFSFRMTNASPLSSKKYWKVLMLAACFASWITCAPRALAQLQQPLVFSSGGAVAVRNDQTAALTAVSGSPFTANGQALVIDVQGRFLFSIGTNSIHMYQITNPTTGAYQEVPHSPFASSNTNHPAYIAVEPTGQYIAVVNQAGQNPGDGLVETFQISPTATGGPALIPVSGSNIELDSTAVGFAQPPNNQEFLLFLGANPQSPDQTIQNGSEFQELAIDPQTGFLTGYQQDAAVSSRGDSFAMDPQGRYYVTGTQDNLLEFGMIQLFGLDGNSLAGNVQFPMQNYPTALWIDSTGAFLYVATSDLGNPVVINIFSVDLQTGALTETASSPLPGFTAIPPYFADRTGSFNYGFGTDQNIAIAYAVDPLTGYFITTANSPFTVPQIAGALTFSIPPGQEGISGPSISLSASNFSFGSIQTGSASQPQALTLTSNGGQALSINSISIGGADSSQFVETDTCQAPSVLQPNKFCSVSITFQPTSTGVGSQQATLSIIDNAPGSPQSVMLTGTGVAPPPPAPAVSASPDPVGFSTITQGTTSSPTSLVITNSGTAALHISSVAIGGNNVGDFTTTNGCSGTINVKATCTITITFAPLAAGQRSETITISDDASDSPQVINVGGNANPAVTLGAAPSASTSATVSAGQTAQFNLQITPGPGYTGTVSLSCSGAPLGATCQVPSSLQIANGNAAPFTVMVTTSGATSLFVPFSNQLPATPFSGLREVSGFILAFLLLLLAFSVVAHANPRPKHLAFARALRATTFVLFACLVLTALWTVAGCGGGNSAITTPPPIVTPQGTSSIVVTPSANAANGQSLQLQPIQLTLTVQ